MNRMDVSSKRCRRFLPLGESHAIYGMEGGQKLIKHQYIRKLLSVNVGVKCLKKDMHHLMI